MEEREGITQMGHGSHAPFWVVFSAAAHDFRSPFLCAGQYQQAGGEHDENLCGESRGDLKDSAGGL